MDGRILIIGAGQAGMQIAVTLRDEGFAGEVTIVGDEAYGPYQRPPLSKAYLAGNSDVESLELRAEHFYTDQAIEMVTGETIVDVRLGEPGSSDAGIATAASGRTFEFDRLAITPGSTPRRLPIEGADLGGVLYLRSLADADALKKRWTAAENLVVIGGGFIGLEVAAAARTAGKTVTVIEVADRLMARAVSSTTSEFYHGAHERRGTRVVLEAQLARIVGDAGQVTGVELAGAGAAKGEFIPADIVMVGIGVIARGELADKLGLDNINGAIVVNEYAETSDPRIVAAGDAVLLPHPLGHDGQVRLESVQNAVDQAKVAAKTLIGIREVHRAVPWFWSDQGDLKLQIAGLSTGFDQIVERGSQESEKFSVLYYRDGRLLAIDAVNDPIDYIAVRRALDTGAEIPAELAADSSVALKTLITSREA
ncbi:3-phenylpropionate/trans-cinnamate dioxygenase ferredoxin reductase subunit [Rhodoglobus vestalii]|uniref:3-phenylpropionate/trans-cinnamate dioxygenase ferredoxin reductase subunit n=1 Tax=Rhodoglobus vestalii TaxID=193384 RepID=A0A8H2K8F4_9MICO|nr:FAD-dependent oxidoreductase [Rhodoglobus vestalii]TQO20584.1 3-phenylpropionate/trans-cinnamate dioxygenase ferredoxin reductase subunit [Rhodoglobus vestalii]